MTEKQNQIVTQLALLNLQLGRYLNNCMRRDDEITEEKIKFVNELGAEILKTSHVLEQQS